MHIFRCVLMFLILVCTHAFACDERVLYSPKEGVDVEILTHKQTIFYKVDTSVRAESGQITVDTEKKLKLTIEDYNFDGYRDFSISHLDDGMGVFNISRVFLFSPTDKDFREIFPDCGDEFLNLKKDVAAKALVSTYFKDNVPEFCTTHVIE